MPSAAKKVCSGTYNLPVPTSRRTFPGSAAAASPADLVVLGRDPMKEDPSTLVTIPIERTMVGGA